MGDAIKTVGRGSSRALARGRCRPPGSHSSELTRGDSLRTALSSWAPAVSQWRRRRPAIPARGRGIAKGRRVRLFLLGVAREGLWKDAARRPVGLPFKMEGLSRRPLLLGLRAAGPLLAQRLLGLPEPPRRCG